MRVHATRPWVLGISASHNGGACLLHGDDIVVAVQEERLVRDKRARTRGASNPLSVRYCLDVGGIGPHELDMAVLCGAQSNQSAANNLESNRFLRPNEHGIRTLSIPHHLGHAAGAFATSGFSEAAILIIDGMGSPHADLTREELNVVVGSPVSGHETISLYRASGCTLTPLAKHLVDQGNWMAPAPNGRGMQRFGSLGGMYGAVAEQIFGDPLDGAGKVMGLAPFGTPTIPVSEFFEVNADRFQFKDGVPQRFQANARWPECQEQYNDLAASVQRALEEAVMLLAKSLRTTSGERRLCYAGGVALNSVANERLVNEGIFDEIFFMPAAEDSGTAIGAAYFGLWQLRSAHRPRAPKSDSLGRTYLSSEIERAIERTPGIIAKASPSITAEAAERLAVGEIIGWFQGGAELGPRALGHRSILADARGGLIKDKLNASIKFREAFRPFAPAILQEEVSAWFEVGPAFDSPYMLRVCRFRGEAAALVPAVVHTDGTGRVQTVKRDANPLFHELLECFKDRTGVPLLLNTSFNIAGDPIVETPHDALWTLLSSALDAVAIGEFIVTKAPGVRTLMDLHGTLIAEGASVHPQVNRPPVNPYQRLPCAFVEDALEWMRDEIDSLGIPYVAFRVSAHSGWVVHVYPASVTSVTELMDGTRTGWQILQQLNSPQAESMTARKLESLLRAWAMAGIATFETAAT
jgi:carbamoyltransferase